MATSGTDAGIIQLSDPAPTMSKAWDATWEKGSPWSSAVHTWLPAEAIWAGVGVKNGSRLWTAVMAWATSAPVGCLLGATTGPATGDDTTAAPPVLLVVLGADVVEAPPAAAVLLLLADTFAEAPDMEVLAEAAPAVVALPAGRAAGAAGAVVEAPDWLVAGAELATGLGLAMAEACSRAAIWRARVRFPPVNVRAPMTKAATTTSPMNALNNLTIVFLLDMTHAPCAAFGGAPSHLWNYRLADR